MRGADPLCSYAWKLDLKGLREAAAMFKNVEWRDVTRSNDHYRACHKRAYKMAGENAMLQGFFIEKRTKSGVVYYSKIQGLRGSSPRN